MRQYTLCRIQKQPSVTGYHTAALGARISVVDDSEQELGCPDAILACMRGEGLAYFSDTRNIRDILLGAILSKLENGHAYDYAGNAARWASHGRQKEIVFSIFEKNQIF